jgi:hypothetical protein
MVGTYDPAVTSGRLAVRLAAAATRKAEHKAVMLAIADKAVKDREQQAGEGVNGQ